MSPSRSYRPEPQDAYSAMDEHEFYTQMAMDADYEDLQRQADEVF